MQQQLLPPLGLQLLERASLGGQNTRDDRYPMATEKMLDPNQATMVPHLAASDLEQPPCRVLSVELGQPTMSDDEYLLDHVVAVGNRHAQRFYPVGNARQPGIIKSLERGR